MTRFICTLAFLITVILPQNVSGSESPQPHQIPSFKKLMTLDKEIYRKPQQTLAYLKSLEDFMVAKKASYFCLYYLRLAQSYDAVMDRKNFVRVHQIGLSRINQVHDSFIKTQYQLNQARIFIFHSQYDRATSQLLDTLKFTKKNKLLKSTIQTLQLLAYSQAQTENFELALTELNEAKANTINIHDNALKAKIEKGFGSVYVYQHNYQLAIQHFNNALKYYNELGYLPQHNETILDLAMTYRHAKKWQQALNYLKKYQKDTRQYSSNYNQFLINYGYAMTYSEQQKYDLAFPYLQKALRLPVLKDFHFELYKMRALYYASQHKFQQSQKDLKQAKNLLRSIPELDHSSLELSLLKIQSEIYFYQKKYLQAYQSLLQYSDQYQQTVDSKISQHLTDLEANRFTQTRELELKLLRKQSELDNEQLLTQKQINQKQRQINYYLLAITLAIIIFIFWQYFINKKLKRLSNHDALTGLYNRRFIFQKLNILINNLDLKKGRLTVMVMDLDDFKSVNDRFGHPVGDKFLQKIATIGLSVLRPGDLFARIGGEEFMLILPRTELNEGQQVAERIRKSVEQTKLNVPNTDPINLTTSIGIAPYNIDNMTAETIYAHADKALYEAKQQGKNSINIWYSNNN